MALKGNGNCSRWPAIWVLYGGSVLFQPLRFLIAGGWAVGGVLMAANQHAFRQYGFHIAITQTIMTAGILQLPAGCSGASKLLFYG